MAFWRPNTYDDGSASLFRKNVVTSESSETFGRLVNSPRFKTRSLHLVHGWLNLKACIVLVLRNIGCSVSRNEHSDCTSRQFSATREAVAGTREVFAASREAIAASREAIAASREAAAASREAVAAW